MPSLPSSSTTSAAFRLEWRPSRWLLGGLALLTALAPPAALASDLPRPLAWPLAAVSAGYGVALILRERRRPRRVLVLGRPASPPTLDGEALASLRLHWRGPLAFLEARDRSGRRHRLAWWPDTLPPAARRELRLAAARDAAVRQRGAMAP